MRTLLAVVVVAVCLAPVAGAASTATTASNASNDPVTITVTVVDENGDGVSGANVSVSYDNETQTGKTFSNGKVFFDVPEGADVSVDATHPDLALNAPEDASSVSGSTEVELQMFPASTAVVSVQTPEGNAVEDATVRLRKDDEFAPTVSGKTAANGTFVKSGVEQGNYSVVVERAGYYGTETSFYVSNRAGKTVTVEPGSVTVEFRTIDGRFDDDRALAANVEIYDGDEFVSNISTGESGTRGVSLDVNARYRVVVKKSGYVQETHRLSTGESDKTASYDLNRTPSLSVTAENSQVITGQTVDVTVVDEYDEPVEGASVQVDGETVGETDANGDATVTIERTGNVSITAVSGSLQASTNVRGFEPSTASTTTTTTTTTAPPTTTTTEPPTTTTTSSATGTDAGDGDEGGGPMPGFGAFVALFAVALSVAVLARRTDD